MVRKEKINEIDYDSITHFRRMMAKIHMKKSGLN